MSARQDAAAASARPSRFFSAFTAVLALSLIGGFLNFVHRPPLGGFESEWSAVFLFAFAAILLLPALPTRIPVSPSLMVWPSVLAALLGIQAGLGFFEYAQGPVLWLGYLALVTLAMLAGQGIRAAGLTEHVVIRLAWILVLASALNSLAQFAQAYRLERMFAPFVFEVVAERGCSIYGNLGQSNLSSLLAWLGIAAALYLLGTGRLRVQWALPILAALLISSALTASRMAWLFLAFTAAAIFFGGAWPANDRRGRWLIAAMLAGGFIVANLVAAQILAGIDPRCATSVERLTTRADGGVPIRWVLWQEAVEVWRTSPWIGVGVYKFLPAAYAIGPVDGHRPLDMYAHNAALQILAEFGVAGVGAVAAAVGYWLVKLIRNRRELLAGDALCLVWVGLIGIHSMLEFPLWYTHFLMLFGLVLGLLVRPGWSMPTRALRLRLPLLTVALLLLAGALAVQWDYRNLQRLFWLERQQRAFGSEPSTGARMLLETARAEVRLFRPLADNLALSLESVGSGDLRRKVAVVDRLLANATLPDQIVRRVALAALERDGDAARWHLRRAFGFFPREAESMGALMHQLLRDDPPASAWLQPILKEELARRPRPRW